MQENFLDKEGENIMQYCFCYKAMYYGDVIDEFKLKKCNLFYSERTIVRWISYIFIMASILLTGVFGSDQFIYANF